MGDSKIPCIYVCCFAILKLHVWPQKNFLIFVDKNLKTSATYDNINESHRYNERKKPDTKRYTPIWFHLHDLTQELAQLIYGVRTQNSVYLWESIDRMAHKGTLWNIINGCLAVVELHIYCKTQVKHLKLDSSSKKT